VIKITPEDLNFQKLRLTKIRVSLDLNFQRLRLAEIRVFLFTSSLFDFDINFHVYAAAETNKHPKLPLSTSNLKSLISA
jgi:hypothetical protein